MQLLRAVALSAILATLVSARSEQEPPPATATLVIKKSYDIGAGFGTGTRQLYFTVADRNCKAKKKIAAFSLVTGNEKVVEVAADRAVTIWAFTEHFSARYQTLCQNAFSFTPARGARYVLMLQTAVYTGCQVVVQDSASSAPPLDLNYDNDLQCKRI